MLTVTKSLTALAAIVITATVAACGASTPSQPTKTITTTATVASVPPVTNPSSCSDCSSTDSGTTAETRDCSSIVPEMQSAVSDVDTAANYIASVSSDISEGLDPTSDAQTTADDLHNDATHVHTLRSDAIALGAPKSFVTATEDLTKAEQLLGDAYEKVEGSSVSSEVAVSLWLAAFQAALKEFDNAKPSMLRFCGSSGNSINQ